jgi:hypothetical protein
VIRSDPEEDLRPGRSQQGSELNDAQELSLRDLVSRLSTDVPLLLRQEAELAKAEIDERLDRTKNEVVKTAIGGAIAYAGVLALVCALIAGLSSALPLWLAALGVGALLCIAGYTLLRSGGKELAEMRPVGERAARNIKTDVRVLKEAAQ